MRTFDITLFHLNKRKPKQIMSLKLLKAESLPLEFVVLFRLQEESHFRIGIGSFAVHTFND
jgi:hypothetical protein